MTILMIALCGVNVGIYLASIVEATANGGNPSGYIGAICGWIVALAAYVTLYIRERRGNGN